MGITPAPDAYTFARDGRDLPDATPQAYSTMLV
jgi:hypothetical protein